MLLPTCVASPKFIFLFSVPSRLSFSTSKYKKNLFLWIFR
jgi:hypothetical protein